jgi:hypothetical protein
VQHKIYLKAVTSISTDPLSQIYKRAKAVVVQNAKIFKSVLKELYRLCGLVVRVFDYRSMGPGFDSWGTTKNVVDLERGPLSLVSTTEELLDRKVAAPV